MLFSKQLALGGRVRLRSGVFVAFKEEKNAVLLIHDHCGSLIGSRAPGRGYRERGEVALLPTGKAVATESRRTGVWCWFVGVLGS